MHNTRDKKHNPPRPTFPISITFNSKHLEWSRIINGVQIIWNITPTPP